MKRPFLLPRIILVNTAHPGNIGQAARAMKTMGLSELYLVNPQKFPDKEAFYRASRADDLVRQIIVTPSLSEALHDCTLAFGLSARVREMPQTMLNIREAVERITHQHAYEKIAFVFGNEKFGLSNEDLQLCQFHVKIPAVSDYSSLNLAAAVQVVSYELRMAMLEQANAKKSAGQPLLASHDELEGLYDHLKKTMIEIDFLNPKNPRKMMERFRQMFNRALLDHEDVNLIRGMLSAIQKLLMPKK